MHRPASAINANVLTDVTGGSASEGWAASDLEFLLRNRRVIAVLDISLGERNLAPLETGAQIARAFPELRDNAAVAAGSILPVQGLGQLTEAEKESLINAARSAIFPAQEANGLAAVRAWWTEQDRAALVAIPRALAVSHILSEHGWTLEEMHCRAFPVQYPGGRYRDILPVVKLDELAGSAVVSLWHECAEGVRKGLITIPKNFDKVVPDVYDQRDIRDIVEED